MLVTQGNGPAEEGQQVVVPAGLVPGESAAAVRIAPSLHADLVAVVDAGRAGEGHLEQRGQLQRGLVPLHQRQEARHVVAAEEIELRQCHLPVVEGQHKIYGIGELDCAQWLQLVASGTLSGVQALSAEEAQAGAVEDVVHHRVELIPLQPALGIEPYLAHDVCLWVSRFHHAAELLPELIVVYLLGHVQAPAVCAELDPVSGHVENEAAHGRRFDVELGQRG